MFPRGAWEKLRALLLGKKVSEWIYCEAACVKWEASLENVDAKMLPNTTRGKESGYT